MSDLDNSKINELVSVIVPIFNVEKYLEKCICSITGQTYKNLEIILVDDGATDNCPKICDDYALKDKRVRVIHKKNGGLSDARNVGIDCANGQYLFFVDSDDYIHPQTIELLLESIYANHTDLVLCNFKYVDEDGNEIKKDQQFIKNETMSSMEALKMLYTANQVYFVVAWNKLYKKSLFDEIRFPVGKIHEDEFVAHLLLYASRKISIVDNELYYYVQRKGSITFNKSIKKNLDVLEALRLRCFFFNEKTLVELVNNAFVAYFYYFFSLRKELGKYSKKELKKQKKSFKMTAKKCKQFLSFKHKLLGSFPYLYLMAMKCKKSLVNIYRGIKKFFFCHNKRIMKMRFSKKEKCILLDTPLHGNLGDQAIAIAERNYLKENFPHHSICEFDFSECSNYLKYIKKYIRKNDIVFIHGGGFVGSLWPNEQRMFINLLNTFKDNRIIVFPQTVYFYKEDYVSLKECIEVMNSCSNLIFFTREKKSYEFMKNQGLTCKIDLIPDIVLYLSYKPRKIKKNGKVLLCFRQDKEKICNQDAVIRLLQDLNIEFDETDTVIDSVIKKKNSKKLVYDKISQFSEYSLIICDRLHALIFSTLAGTSCIAFDNVSHKVSGVYEWIKELNYIQCISDSELTADLIVKMMEKEEDIYNRNILIKEYNKIKEWCDQNENRNKES